MTSDALPVPPVPADCDLRQFPDMPLEVTSLRDSDLRRRSTGDEFKAAIVLWCASWHQVPCGSLPDDDVELADLAGIGTGKPAVRAWQKLRGMALRGWFKASDGRLYHELMAKKANAGLAAKQAAKRKRDADAERLRTWRETRNSGNAETVLKRVSSQRDQNRTEVIGSDRNTHTVSERDEHDIAAPPAQSQPPAADADRWGYVRTEAWAKNLIAAGCKIGAGSWPAWKSICDRWPIARVIEIASTVPATERFSGQVEEALKSAGTASSASIVAKKTRTLDLSA